VGGHRPLMISNVVLHSLPAGYRFDLRRRHRIAAPALRAVGAGEAASS
jgi:cyanophycinase-like exopeptidase